ncbi:MAG: MT-A70 family methyltransferase [Candidatus Asgardarchaeia archaeon]
MIKKYKTIYADPPWNERGGGKIKRGADKHYPLMKTSDIIAMGDFIKSISEDNCHLYLWVTNNFFFDGGDVMEAWGFRYITKITWFKEGKIGLGQYFRGVTEDCLFGVKGRLPYKVIDGKRQQGKTGFSWPRGKHSEKPEAMRKMIEKVSYSPRVEIFARPTETVDIFADPSPVWDYIGNEIDGKDIRKL